jgi:hypothetical protein
MNGLALTLHHQDRAPYSLKRRRGPPALLVRNVGPIRRITVPHLGKCALLCSRLTQRSSARPPTTPARTPPAAGMNILPAAALDAVVDADPAAVFVGALPPPVTEPGAAVAPAPPPPAAVGVAAHLPRYEVATSEAQIIGKQVLEFWQRLA